MESARFDQITSRFARPHSRRGALGLLGLAVLGGAGLSQSGQDAEARKKKHRGKKGNKGGNNGGGSTTPGKGLREICTPGVDTCSNGLMCDTPTTRHTCSDTVSGVDSWCCVPPGGSCTECDCCGDYYCKYDDQNIPSCVPNPEM